MGNDRWYRNETWDADIEAAFRARLSKARSQRPQYLKLQAGHLAVSMPQIALQLVAEYFETGDEFFVADAYGIQARAFRQLNKIDDAVSAYVKALDWEDAHPGLITNARLDYPRLVAENRLAQQYDNALTILLERFRPSDFLFPASKYLWNGSQALILHEQRRMFDARHFADRALAAVSETQSPFQYHRSIGIVIQTSDNFGRRIKAIAQPSTIRSLSKLLKFP